MFLFKDYNSIFCDLVIFIFYVIVCLIGRRFFELFKVILKLDKFGVLDFIFVFYVLVFIVKEES